MLSCLIAVADFVVVKIFQREVSQYRVGQAFKMDTFLVQTRLPGFEMRPQRFRILRKPVQIQNKT